jgi:hypothetical protein
MNCDHFGCGTDNLRGVKNAQNIWKLWDQTQLGTCLGAEEHTHSEIRFWKLVSNASIISRRKCGCLLPFIGIKEVAILTKTSLWAS